MKKVTFALLATTLILTACSSDKDAQVDTSVETDTQMVEQPAVVEDDSEMMEDDSQSDAQEEMSDEQDTMESQDDDMMSEDEAGVEVEAEVQQEVKVGNEYVVYSQEVMADTQNPKILFFHATWCPTCKAANTAFESVENTIGLDVVKVDYDEYSDLKTQYGVVSQHTFVLVDGNGNMLKRWYGSKNYDEILEELQS